MKKFYQTIALALILGITPAIAQDLPGSKIATQSSGSITTSTVAVGAVIIATVAILTSTTNDSGISATGTTATTGTVSTK